MQKGLLLPAVGNQTTFRARQLYYWSWDTARIIPTISVGGKKECHHCQNLSSTKMTVLVKQGNITDQVMQKYICIMKFGTPYTDILRDKDPERVHAIYLYT